MSATECPKCQALLAQVPEASVPTTQVTHTGGTPRRTSEVGDIVRYEDVHFYKLWGLLLFTLFVLLSLIGAYNLEHWRHNHAQEKPLQFQRKRGEIQRGP